MQIERTAADRYFKSDPEKEKAARESIEAVTDERFSTDDYAEAFPDGVFLCK